MQTTEPKPKKPLTQSQKLRLALMGLWQRSKLHEKPGSFEEFYQDRMDKLIRWVNEKPR